MENRWLEAIPKLAAHFQVEIDDMDFTSKGMSLFSAFFFFSRFYY